MLRELNENEMIMVSGGSIDGQGNPWLLDKDAAPTTQNQSSEVYYNGHMYSSQGAANVARTRDGRLNTAHGNNNTPSPGPNPQDQVPTTSPVSPVNTGTTVGTVGPATIGVGTTGGLPPTGGFVSATIPLG